MQHLYPLKTLDPLHTNDIFQEGSLSADTSVVGYRFHVTNTGTVTLKDIRILDSMLGVTAITCPGGDLPPLNR